VKRETIVAHLMDDLTLPAALMKKRDKKDAEKEKKFNEKLEKSL